MARASERSLWAAACLQVLLGSARAQQSNGTTASPTVGGTFTYTQVTSDQYATALPSPLSFATPFAPAFTDASSLLPANMTSTTWSLDRQATATPDGPYGQSAYAALWATLSYTNETLPFTTTATPTPVARSELVRPPDLPVRQTPGADNLTLPADFVWGVSSSAWQIEGGLQWEGRGPAGLDDTGAIGSNSTGNDSMVADMSYFMYKQDIARLAALGVPHFSFSISWPRIVPFGKAGTPVNSAALDHYDDVINTCLAYGVTPVVTLVHFDYPSTVDYASNDTAAFVDDFMYYAKTVVTRYADRVPVWVTFNEPNIFLAYLANWAVAGFTNHLVAHATFYRWYKDVLGGTARVSIKLASTFHYPLHGPDNATDVAAAQRAMDLNLGILADPLFLGAQYPATALAISTLGLTPLTDAQIDLVNGTCDFFAVDAYNTVLATPTAGGIEDCAANRSDAAWPLCVDTTAVEASGWIMGATSAGYTYSGASAFTRQMLGVVWQRYRPAGGIMLTEFGFPEYAESEKTLDMQRYDLERTIYYQGYLAEMLRAVYEDGVKMVGALAWSIMDNNEFGSYAAQYGMQTVNRTDGTWARHYKRSFFDYVDFFHTHAGGH